MNTFLFIMAAILLVGFRSYKAKLRQLADQEDSSKSAKAASKSTSEQSFDERLADQKSWSSSISGMEHSYFSYEFAEDSDLYETPSPKKKDQSSADTHVDSLVENVNFDLREAIIYQTILSNKYLDEMQSLDN